MRRAMLLLFFAAATYAAQMKFEPSQKWKSLVILDLYGWHGLEASRPNGWVMAQSVALDPANPKLLGSSPRRPGRRAF